MKKSQILVILIPLSIIWVLYPLFDVKFAGFNSQTFIRMLFFLMISIGSLLITNEIEKVFTRKSSKLIKLFSYIQLSIQKIEKEDKLKNLKIKMNEVRNSMIIDCVRYHLLDLTRLLDLNSTDEDIDSILESDLLFNKIYDTNMSKKEIKYIINYRNLYNSDEKFNRIFMEYKDNYFVKTVESDIMKTILSILLALFGAMLSIIAFINFDNDLIFKITFMVILFIVDLYTMKYRINEHIEYLNNYYEDLIQAIGQIE